MTQDAGERRTPPEWERKQAPWVKRLILRGRGSYANNLKRPLIVDVVTGGRPYVNLSHGDLMGAERYVVSLSPAEWEQMKRHVDASLSGRSGGSDG